MIDDTKEKAIAGVAVVAVAGVAVGAWWLWSKFTSGWGADTQWVKLDQVNIGVPVISAPVLTVSDVAAEQVVLYWSGYCPADGWWRIERANNLLFTGAAQFTAGSSVRWFIDAINPSTTYYYRVQAYNLSINYPWSNIVQVTTPAIQTTPPAAPSMLNATAPMFDQVNLTWQDNANNEDGFEVHRALNSAFTTGLISIIIPGANTTAFTNFPVESNTTYYYRVRAYNAYGNSTWSNVVSITTPLQQLGQGFAFVPEIDQAGAVYYWMRIVAGIREYSTFSFGGAGFLPTTTIWNVDYPDFEEQLYTIEIELYDGIGPFPGNRIARYSRESYFIKKGYIYGAVVQGGSFLPYEIGPKG